MVRSPVFLVVLLCFAVVSALAVDETLSDAPDPDHLPLVPAEALLDGCFATSGACALCHSNADTAVAMRDAQGHGIAPFDLWQASMMANSARDPLWRAVVSAEVAQTPARKADIEAKCLQCHAPMAATEARHAGRRLAFEELYDRDARWLELGIDGVSCTVCHQMEPDNFGLDASFSGNYEINARKEIYGPHADPFQMPMFRHTGFVPTPGQHILQSELCGTCHTLETHAWDPDGAETGHVFLEQAPYLEWRASEFGRSGTETCQSCHMPRIESDGSPTETRIARNPGGFDFGIEERSPYGKHLFVGGNTLLPQIFRDHADALSPQAPPAAFDRTIALARQQLQTRTAKVQVTEATMVGGELRFAVDVENLTGHKFPTAHPVRRAWLHVRVVDAAGRVAFESGGYDARGRLVSAAGELDPTERRGGAYHRHYTSIDDPSQVQVYQGVMADRHGEVTHSLVRAAAWKKDNRLLPRGYRADGRTEPVGVDDPDFRPGRDRTEYRVRLPRAEGSAPGTLTIEAELVYQVLSARFANELFSHATPEVREFRGYYESVDPRPERVGSDRVTVKPGAGKKKSASF